MTVLGKVQSTYTNIFVSETQHLKINMFLKNDHHNNLEAVYYKIKTYYNIVHCRYKATFPQKFAP